MMINNLSQHFLEEHPRESAKVLEGFAPDELSHYFETHPDNLIANVLRYFMPGAAVACLLGMEVRRAGGVLEQLGIDAAARLLRRMKSTDQITMLNAVTGSYSYRLKSILRYPADTVGQHMSPNVFTASESMLAKEVISMARTTSSELQGDIFLVNDNQHLVGMIDVKNLVFADPDIAVNMIMRIPDVVLNARTNLDYVKEHPKWRFKDALPVVDHKNVFAGVLKRAVMFEALSGDQNPDRTDETFMDTVMEVADLFWEICTNIVLPKTETRAEGSQDDQK